MKIKGIKMDRIIELLTIFGQKHRQMIKSIYLFGSMVRGDYGSDSDLDILIIVEKGYKYEIRKRLNNSKEFDEANTLFSNKYIIGINPIIDTLQGIIENFDNLHQTVMREGVLIFGEKIEESMQEIEIKEPEKIELKELIEEIKQAFPIIK